MPPLLAYLSAAIAVVSFLGVAAVYLRGSADKGTIESQERRLKSQGEEISDLTRRLGIAEENAKTALSENAVLRDAVSHVDEVRNLQTTLDVHHEESIAVLNKIADAVEAA